MSLGLGIFASVVLILVVYHKGFRKVFFWIGGIALILATLGVGAYWGYDSYSTWKTNREAQRQAAENEKGVEACMTRLGTPMPSKGTTPDFFPAAYANNLTACKDWPDNVSPIAGFIPDLPAGYAIDVNGKVSPFAPPSTITVDPLPLQTKPKKASAPAGLPATATCDVVVYDRDRFDYGDPEAIGMLHSGDPVRYLGHVTIGDQEIIQFHGRRGYVDSCLDIGDSTH